jgi:hypothetical protein
MQSPLSDKDNSVSSFVEHRSRAPKSWPQWIQSAATLLTASLPQNDSHKSNEFGGPDKKKPIFEVSGYLGGEIYYVSPPLNSFSNGERMITLPTSIRERANDIIESEEILKQHGARAVELVCPIFPSRVEFLGSKNEKELEVSAAVDFGTEEYHKSRDIADEKLTEILARKQIRILSVISELVRNHPTHKDAVIFLEENGMVGLAPIGTRIGDYICRVDESDAVAIVREHQDNLWMIARAMQLSPLARIDRSCPHVGFDMDIQNLKLLTRSSTCDCELALCC